MFLDLRILKELRGYFLDLQILKGLAYSRLETEEERRLGVKGSTEPAAPFELAIWLTRNMVTHR